MVSTAGCAGVSAGRPAAGVGPIPGCAAAVRLSLSQQVRGGTARHDTGVTQAACWRWLPGGPRSPAASGQSWRPLPERAGMGHMSPETLLSSHLSQEVQRDGNPRGAGL